jgi:hypothetical protein
MGICGYRTSREALVSREMPEGATVGGTGGIIGLLAGIGALVIPDWDQFIAAGPIIAALSGVGIGALAGALIGFAYTWVRSQGNPRLTFHE